MAITADRVLAILQRYGVDAVFRTYATTSYDPASGEVTLEAATDHTHKIIPPYSPRRADLERWSGVEGVKEAEALSAVSASGLTFTPAVGMEVLYGGKTWRIVSVHPIQFQASVILYEFALTTRAGG
jgi:hypothetical protein